MQNSLLSGCTQVKWIITLLLITQCNNVCSHAQVKTTDWTLFIVQNHQFLNTVQSVFFSREVIFALWYLS